MGDKGGEGKGQDINKINNYIISWTDAVEKKMRNVGEDLNFKLNGQGSSHWEGMSLE